MVKAARPLGPRPVIDAAIDLEEHLFDVGIPAPRPGQSHVGSNL